MQLFSTVGGVWRAAVGSLDSYEESVLAGRG
jgi:hypothetical protein